MRARRLTLAAVLGACAVLSGSGPAPVGSQGAAPAVRMIAVEGEGAYFWPRWRGPSGQGLVDGSGYTDRWSATENVIWRSTVPGSGNSSPIVWADRIFLTTGRDGGSQLFVLAYRRSDGALLWETEVAPGPPERVHRKNGPASATPVTDGERVYVSLGGRGLVALDLDGNVLWHTEIGQVANYHGPAGSPLLYRDRLIIYQDQKGGAFVAAYDTATGAEVWRTPRDASVGWGTPVAIRVGDHDELIVSSQRNVTAYNPDTGRERWRCEGNRFEVIPTPVVAAGLVFCTSGRAVRRSPSAPAVRAMSPIRRRLVDAARVALRPVAHRGRRLPLHHQRHVERRCS